MVVVPLSASGNDPESRDSGSSANESADWLRVSAAGMLALSGVLLMAGKRRAGLAAATAGTALTFYGQQDTVRACWHRVPQWLDEAQSILNRVQGAVEELSAQGERLRNILSR